MEDGMRVNSLALAVILALAACSTGPKVTVDFDPAADLRSYSSYSWAYVATPPGMNPLLFQRVKEAIDRTLRSRGYMESANAQFAIAFTIGSRDRVEVTDLGTYGPYYRRWGGWQTPYSQVDIRDVTDGTLVIDIYDATTKRPVWHGKATKEIRPSQVDQMLIDEAVAAVLAKFPPPAA
jgi:hypothetical protein